MKLTKSIEEYLESKREWNEALLLLREIFLNTELQECLKWGMPTYTLNNKNVAAFSAFKSFVAIWFQQGSFLKDPGKKLMNAQEGVTRGQRQWRFTSVEEIAENRELISSYLEEAIRNQKKGREIKPDRKLSFNIPVELEHAFRSDPSFKDSFNQLSPSKRREYAAYISQAKKEETRAGRMEKIRPMILERKGLNDKYR